MEEWRRLHKEAASLGRSNRSLLVTFRERIGLHQVGGLVDHVILTIEAGMADAQLAPQMMVLVDLDVALGGGCQFDVGRGDRKSTRLNSSHVRISYAVFCLKKKKKT